MYSHRDPQILRILSFSGVIYYRWTWSTRTRVLMDEDMPLNLPSFLWKLVTATGILDAQCALHMYISRSMRMWSTIIILCPDMRVKPVNDSKDGFTDTGWYDGSPLLVLDAAPPSNTNLSKRRQSDGYWTVSPRDQEPVRSCTSVSPPKGTPPNFFWHWQQL